MKLRRLFPVLALIAAGCAQPPADNTAATTAAPAAAPAQNPEERGRYLTTLGGCHDCHTPKTMGPMGPEPDMTRAFSGHPASEKLPAVPKDVLGPDKWGMVGNNNFTAFVGPWGISFARNLTPDTATGLGSWTEAMFIKTIRDGKHQGEGRPLLPPMPWPMYRNMTDDDLKAVFAYLRSVKPIANAVPEPVPAEKLGQ
jgi:cytochrome c553